MLVAVSKRQRDLWQMTYGTELPNARPARLAELPADVQKFIHEKLEPRLTHQERGKLTRLEGKYPEYVKEVRRLADARRP